jgi:hypothetical protein
MEKRLQWFICLPMLVFLGANLTRHHTVTTHRASADSPLEDSVLQSNTKCVLQTQMLSRAVFTFISVITSAEVGR